MQAIARTLMLLASGRGHLVWSSWYTQDTVITEHSEAELEYLVACMPALLRGPD